MRRVVCAIAICLAAPASARAAECPDEVPAAVRMTGLPDAAIAGKAYTVTLEEVGDGALDRAGATLSVLDRTGRGWSARYQYVRGLTQEFTLGLRGPYTVSATYTELHAEQCTRTLTAKVPIVRRIFAVVACERRAARPTILLLRCGGDRLRVRRIRWTGWNGNTTTGTGRLGGERATITLSSPRQCDTLDGFIYTRARVKTATRSFPRIPIACPIPD